MLINYEDRYFAQKAAILKAINEIENEDRMTNRKLDLFTRGFRCASYIALRHLEDIRDTVE
jgi:hypothetical protein